MIHAGCARYRLSAIVGATLVPLALLEAQSPALEVLLDRLGTYLVDYETKVVDLAADEQFEQWVKRRPGYVGATVARRKIQSTFFLIRLPDGRAWLGFRDVTRVDGNPVPARARSMAQALGEGTPDAFDEALAMMRENAKYNIGGVYRTINLPLQALEMLHPQYRHRFHFTLAGNARIGGRQATAIEFAEFARPTLVSDGFDGELLAHVQAWVEPASGAVLRTDLRFEGAGAWFLKESLIRVDYAHDRRMQVLLPSMMEETYGLNIEVLHGRATYRNYRRFETSARLIDQPR
jgi:hypothetical protein